MNSAITQTLIKESFSHLHRWHWHCKQEIQHQCSHCPWCTLNEMNHSMELLWIYYNSAFKRVLWFFKQDSCCWQDINNYDHIKSCSFLFLMLSRKWIVSSECWSKQRVSACLLELTNTRFKVTDTIRALFISVAFWKESLLTNKF